MNHEERGHAKLSASSAHRWLQCTRCIEVESQFPSETSIYAEEGTFMHELSEIYLRNYLKTISKQQFSKELKKYENNKYYSEETHDAVLAYVDEVVKKIDAAREISKDAVVIIEQKVDFSPWVEDGFGTSDVITITDGTLEVIDLKGGKGVEISANDNPQLKLYALGALNEFGFLYDIQNVKMSIVQPRVDNFSTFEMSVEDLLKWAEEELKPKAKLAIKGEGEFCAGEHCRFCRARNQCRARALKNLELMKYEFADSALLTDEEIAEIIGLSGELSKWASDIYTYAAALAINDGKQWDGFKLVQGRSNRKYVDEEAVAENAKAAGYSDIYKKRLITITEMEKLMGKKKFKDIIGSLVEKPKGKLTLVLESDKRKAVETVNTEFQVEE
ncbi:MAG: DUF2800 domain-containing protein [Clostridiaceae bacterium]